MWSVKIPISQTKNLDEQMMWFGEFVAHFSNEKYV